MFFVRDATLVCAAEFLVRIVLTVICSTVAPSVHPPLLTGRQTATRNALARLTCCTDGKKRPAPFYLEAISIFVCPCVEKSIVLSMKQRLSVPLNSLSGTVDWYLLYGCSQLSIRRVAPKWSQMHLGARAMPKTPKTVW